MKKSILLFLLFSFSMSLIAQDIIITKEDERIEARILQEYNAVIQYELYNDPGGTAYFLSKNKIKTITYKNGNVVNYFDSQTNSNSLPFNPLTF
jgi:hypothetical protein